MVWTRDGAALSGLLSLATIWVASSWVMRSSAPPALASIIEAALIALLIGLYLDTAPVLLASLVTAPFVHGLIRGVRGVAETLLVQIVLLAILLALLGRRPDPSQIAELFTWLVTGLGLGLVASFLIFATPADDGTAAYHEARALISELNDLSAKLEGGLDPTSMGGSILEEVSDALPLEAVVLHVHRDGALLPLVRRSTTGDEMTDSSLPALVWEHGEARVIEQDFAFPVLSSGTPVAVVSGRLAPTVHTDPDSLIFELDQLATRLGPSALRLDTAQLFASFRDAAMSEERRRLAREMHDGMAQDIASMGYVVDALISTATPVQEPALVQLRQMITGVVAEVRRSVMTLRTQAGSSESLGAALATLARHLSDVSGTPIKVTVDERTSRLRHEVEAELLRIGQEAMNNAVKHSQASLIDVRCSVQAPYAEIVVSDDGLGLQAGRRDSHGLSIMRERAALIGGVLDVRSSPARGTTVSVRVGENANVPEKTNPSRPSRGR